MSNLQTEELNYLTHSYTIQPVVNMDGEFMKPLYINLKGTANQFGPRVEQSTSDKLTSAHLKDWPQNIFVDIFDI